MRQDKSLCPGLPRYEAGILPACPGLLFCGVTIRELNGGYSASRFQGKCVDRWIVLLLRVREVLLPEDYRGFPQSLQIDAKITPQILQPCTFKMNFIDNNILRVFRKY
jgi:hypothetical protein